MYIIISLCSSSVDTYIIDPPKKHVKEYDVVPSDRRPIDVNTMCEIRTGSLFYDYRRVLPPAVITLSLASSTFALNIHLLHKSRDRARRNPRQHRIRDVHFLVVHDQQKGFAPVRVDFPERHA